MESNTSISRMEQLFIPLEEWKKEELNRELAFYNELEGIEIKKFGFVSKNKDKAEEIARLRKEHGYPIKVTPELIEQNPDFAKNIEAKGIKEGDTALLPQEVLDLFKKFHEEAAEEEKEHAAHLKLLQEIVPDSADKASYIAECAKLGAKELLELVAKVTKDNKAREEEEEAKAKAEAEKKAEDEKESISDKTKDGDDKNDTSDEEGEKEIDFKETEHVYLGKTVTQVNNKLVNGKLYKEVFVANGEGYTISPEEFKRDVKPRNTATE